MIVNSKYEYHEDLDRLGQGSFGTVYKAKNLKTGKYVAIKVIPVNASRSKREALEKEIDLLKHLHHENVVAYFESIHGRQNIYMVMRWCSRGSFEKYVQNNAPLNPRNVRNYMCHLSAGLRYLHNQDIIHRDIKPDNLFISTNDKGKLVLKIGDLGIAKLCDENYGSYSNVYQTQAGTMIYMAPEVILGHRYNAKADLWSCGVVAYRCVQNRFPLNRCDEDFYDKGPSGTSDHIKYPSNICDCLKDMLVQLLRYYHSNRMNSAQFSDHKFLRNKFDDSLRCPNCGYNYKRNPYWK